VKKSGEAHEQAIVIISASIKGQELVLTTFACAIMQVQLRAQSFIRAQ
jgi:hypothetical protein